MSIREKIAATAGDKFKAEASPFGPAKAAFEKMKFKVTIDGNTLVAKHSSNPAVEVKMWIANRDNDENPVFVTKMDCPLFDGAKKEYFIRAKGEGKNASASFDDWYEKAIESFAEVKKLWAKEVNGQIGRQYYWLSGFYAGRMKKGKKKK